MTKKICRLNLCLYLHNNNHQGEDVKQFDFQWIHVFFRSWRMEKEFFVSRNTIVSRLHYSVSFSLYFKRLLQALFLRRYLSAPLRVNSPPKWVKIIFWVRAMFGKKIRLPDMACRNQYRSFSDVFVFINKNGKKKQNINTLKMIIMTKINQIILRELISPADVVSKKSMKFIMGGSNYCGCSGSGGSYCQTSSGSYYSCCSLPMEECYLHVTTSWGAAVCGNC